MFATQNRGFVSQEGGGACLPSPATENQNFALCKYCMGGTTVLRRRWGGACPPPPATQNHRFPSGCWGGAHSRHAPPACDTKPWFCVAEGEGQAPPCPRRNCPLRHIQDLHYAKPWFCVAGGEGLAPPLLRHKTTVLCRKQKLQTQIYDLLLDLDTCLTPEAQN